MTFDQLAAGIKSRDLDGLTLFHYGDEWMVSTKFNGGFRSYYGTELGETVRRALADGPQRLDDFKDLI